MTGARIQATFNDGPAQAAIRRLGGVRPGLLKAFGVALVEDTNQRFERGVDPTGAAWAGLHPAYAMIKRGPGILRESRMLQRSITSAVNGNSVIVGSNRVYAAVHQFGATIRPKNGKRLAFRLGRVGPRGGKSSGMVFAKSVTIPARPYLGIGKSSREAIMDVLDHEIGRTLRG